MNGLGAILRAASTTVALALLSGMALAAQTIEVLTTAGCGCCIGWARHMEQNGFTAELRNLPMADLMQVKIGAGLKPGQTSCHTGRIDGCAIEGHVPAGEVKRLLAERPDAIGLTVPDMPYGSPGMGEAGPDADPHDVLLVRRDGTTEVFASYR
ncbi:Uncharacterized conserved protein [Mesorhizobium albiziae]|uniref:Uncharacterized conserved protein n=1 Tax=Neomesorhizobium albiziae TaxID=335020 RepID=A0A1I4FNV3_9HYPH|nr:DUF411 domain-containing protein [Mesorhizobium albiziae]GLS28443.1 hypothetical protein GCM10007937_01500 [Mesorhizobium albiziae]SFL19129.1 Uncharacterized conserved protein [Mesorhizobium albiziae]